MFALPCSWHPPPDWADAAGAAARSTTTATSPLSNDLLDTSTSRDLGQETAIPAPPLPSSSPADSENRRIGNVASSTGSRQLARRTGAFRAKSHHHSRREDLEELMRRDPLDRA